MPSSSSNPVPFQELTGSPRFSISRRGAKATRHFLVRNLDTFDFVETLGRGSGYSIPLMAPFLPHAYVSAIDVEQFSPDNPPDFKIFTNIVSDYNLFTQGLNPSGGAIPTSLVVATYETDRWNQVWPTNIPKPTIPFGTTLKLRTRTSGQFLTLPPRSGVWATAATSSSSGSTSSGLGLSRILPPDQGMRVLIPTKDIILDWMYVADPPVGTLDGIVGKVNQAAFLGAPPETLLFEGYEIEEDFRVSQNEPYCWTVHMSFKQRVKTFYLAPGFRSVTWNHDYREGGVVGDLGISGWHRVFMTDGKPRYETDNFGLIFSAGGPSY